jgi:hypothetical protein
LAKYPVAGSVTRAVQDKGKQGGPKPKKKRCHHREGHQIDLTYPPYSDQKSETKEVKENTKIPGTSTERQRAFEPDGHDPDHCDDIKQRDRPGTLGQSKKNAGDCNQYPQDHRDE